MSDEVFCWRFNLKREFKFKFKWQQQQKFDWCLLFSTYLFFSHQPIQWKEFKTHFLKLQMFFAESINSPIGFLAFKCDSWASFAVSQFRSSHLLLPIIILYIILFHFFSVSKLWFVNCREKYDGRTVGSYKKWCFLFTNLLQVPFCNSFSIRLLTFFLKGPSIKYVSTCFAIFVTPSPMPTLFYNYPSTLAHNFL